MEGWKNRPGSESPAFFLPFKLIKSRHIKLFYVTCFIPLHFIFGIVLWRRELTPIVNFLNENNQLFPIAKQCFFIVEKCLTTSKKDNHP